MKPSIAAAEYIRDRPYVFYSNGLQYVTSRLTDDEYDKYDGELQKYGYCLFSTGRDGEYIVVKQSGSLGLLTRIVPAQV